MVLKLKTLIMTEKPLFDIHDNYLPQGFYYYDIKKYTQYNTAIGYVISDTIFSTYEFKMFTVIKIMAKAMSKLTRQTDYDYNITNFKSPSNSPVRQPKSLSCSVLPYLNAKNVVISNNNNDKYNKYKYDKYNKYKYNKYDKYKYDKCDKYKYNKYEKYKYNKKIKAKPKKQYDECSICLEPCRFGRYKLQCKHIFHKKCIKEWFKTNKSCPNCRIKLPNIKL